MYETLAQPFVYLAIGFAVAVWVGRAVALDSIAKEPDYFLAGFAGLIAGLLWPLFITVFVPTKLLAMLVKRLT